MSGGCFGKRVNMTKKEINEERECERSGCGKRASKLEVLFKSNSVEWETPQWLFDQLDAEFLKMPNVRSTTPRQKMVLSKTGRTRSCS
jgi:hypothetical protein